MKKFLATILMIVSLFSLAGCTDDTTVHIEAPSEAPPEAPSSITYTADFYDNHGKNWLSASGHSFDIRPNKVKEYYFDTNGIWTYKWTMSSIMSIFIDNRPINSCGSTILFADSRIQKLDINIPTEVNANPGSSAEITTPNDLRFRDYWTLNWWWMEDDQADTTIGSRVVVIQSQEGDPICMYRGNSVTWEVSRNLPKTTEVTIDGMKLFIHRANFSIIDTSILNN